MGNLGTYKRGAKTLSFAVAIAGATSLSGGGGTLDDVGDMTLSGIIEWPWGSASWSLVVHWVMRSSDPASWTLTVSVDTIFGSPATATATGTGAPPATLTGTLTTTIDTDDCDTLTQLLDGTGDLAPFWLRVEDTPPGTGKAIQLIPQPSQSVSATLTINGTSATATGTTGATPAALSYRSRVQNYAYVNLGGTGAMAATFDGNASQTITQTLPLSSLAGLTKTSTQGNATATATESAGYSYARAKATLGGSVDATSAIATADREDWGDRSFETKGVVRRMDQPNADSLDIEVYGVPGSSPLTLTGITASFSASGTQKRGSGSVSTQAAEPTGTDTDTDSNSIDTYASIYQWIKQSSLAAIGEDTSARRLAFRGLKWDALTLSQAASFQIDPCSALTISSGDYQGSWSEAGSGSVAMSGGYVRWSGGSGSVLTRSFAPKAYLAGYRYLRLRAACSVASKSLTISCNGKSWSVTTGGTAGSFADILIDLCLESGGPATSAMDTRWPEDGSGFPSEGAYFGVGATDAITITGLGAGETLDIDELALVADAGSTTNRLNLMQSLGWWQQRIPDATVASITSQYLTTRFAHARLDWVGQTLDEGALLKQIDTGPTTVVTTYTHRSIADLVARIGPRYPGWSATSLKPAASQTGCAVAHPPRDWCYNNDDQWMAHLWGGGCLHSRKVGADPEDGWTYGFNLDALGGSLTVPAQPLYDIVSDFWPGCGDVEQHRDSGAVDDGTLRLRAATILGGRAWGIVADSALAPLSGETVDLTQSATSRGTGTTDSLGGYETGAPFGRAPVASQIEHTPDAIGATIYTRKLSRGVFVAGGDYFGAIAIDEVSGWVHVGEGAKIATYRADFSSPLASVFTSADHPVDQWVELHWEPRGGVLWALGKVGGGYSLVISRDGGQTIQEVHAVTGQSSAFVVDSITGTIVHLVQNGSGNVERYLSRDGGSTWSGPDAVTWQPTGGGAASALSVKVLAIDEDERLAGALFLRAKNGSSYEIYRSFNQGAEWELVG